MAGVEFIGLKQVRDLVEKRNTPFYEVLQGKELKFQNLENDMNAAIDMLDENLSVPQQNGTTTTFTIKFYKKLTAKGDTLDKNSLTGQNNFKLNSNEGWQQYNNNLAVGAPDDSRMRKIEQRVEEIASALAAPAEEEEEEEPQQIGGVWGAVIQAVMSDPQLKAMVIGGVQKIISSVGSAVPDVTKTIMTGQTVHVTEPTEEQKQMINEALYYLVSVDPRFPERLHKLATMRRNKPTQYESVAGMLDMMNF